MQTKTKKIILGIVLVTTLVGVHAGGILGIPQVKAQTASASPQASAAPVSPTSTDQQAQKELNTIIEVLIIVEKAFLALTIPLNIVIGKLLSNDWVYLDGDAYKAIETIWILMRNIVNVVFACLLLIIAIAQIAGAVSGSESKTFALKQALPGFIFGLIFVNFSLLACKVILDVGNLATTAAFSIVNEVGPNLIANGNDPNKEKILMNKSFCWPSQKALKDINATCKSKTGDELAKCIDAWAQPSASDELRTCMGGRIHVAFGQEKVAKLQKDRQALGIDPVNGWTGPEDGKPGDFAIGWSTKAPSDLGTTLFGSRNVMMVYTNSIFRMPEILTLYNDKTGTIVGTGTGILMTTLLTLIFGAMIILINIALVMALGIRMVLIWMILIFSPLMALEFISDGKFIKGFLKSAKFEQGILKGLIGLAFMPAIAGIVLSLGFIIFHVLNKVIYRTTAFTPEGTQIFNIPPFNIEISGSIMPMFSTIGEFIIACILLIILWQALFQMMQTNKYMDGAINKIGKLGETIAGNAKLIPFIPMPGGKREDGKGSKPPQLMSWAGLKRGTEVMERGLEQKHIDDANKEVGDSWFGRFSPTPTGDKGDLAKLRSLNNAGATSAWKQEHMEIPIQILTTGWHGQQTDQTLATEMAKRLINLADRTNMNDKEKGDYKTAVNTWLTNSGSQAEGVKLGKYLATTLHARGDADLKTVMAKYGYADHGIDITGVTKPAPGSTGEPQSQGENKGVHEGTPPSKNNSYHIALTTQLDPTAPARKLDMPAVPQAQLETLWRANEAYQKADVAAKPGLEGPLSTALATVLGHAGVTTIPASLDGTRRSKLADEVLKASKMPAPAAH